MLRSRSSSILTIGFQANLDRTTSSKRKVSAVQRVRPGFRSMIPAARTGATKRVLMRRSRGRCGARWLHLDGEEDADDDREERHAFDEGGRDDHRGADVAGGGRLARRAVEGGSCEAADAEARADDGEAGAEAGGEEREGSAGHRFSCSFSVAGGGGAPRRGRGRAPPPPPWGGGP